MAKVNIEENGDLIIFAVNYQLDDKLKLLEIVLSPHSSQKEKTCRFKYQIIS